MTLADYEFTSSIFSQEASSLPEEPLERNEEKLRNCLDNFSMYGIESKERYESHEMDLSEGKNKMDPAEAKTPKAGAAPATHTPPALVLGTPKRLNTKSHQPQATHSHHEVTLSTSTPATAPPTLRRNKSSDESMSLKMLVESNTPNESKSEMSIKNSSKGSHQHTEEATMSSMSLLSMLLDTFPMTSEQQAADTPFPPSPKPQCICIKEMNKIAVSRLASPACSLEMCEQKFIAPTHHHLYKKGSMTLIGDEFTFSILSKEASNVPKEPCEQNEETPQNYLDNLSVDVLEREGRRENHEMDLSEGKNEKDLAEAPTPKAGVTSYAHTRPASVLGTPKMLNTKPHQVLAVPSHQEVTPSISTPATALLIPWSTESTEHRQALNSSASVVAFGENTEKNDLTGTLLLPLDIQLQLRHHECLVSLEHNQNAKHRSAARFSTSENERTYVSPDDIVTEDIYCGQESRGSSNPGNIYYRDTIAMNKAKYKSYGNKHGPKTKLSTHLLEEVFSGRFVKMDPGNGQYYLMTETEARTKISQALRDK